MQLAAAEARINEARDSATAINQALLHRREELHHLLALPEAEPAGPAEQPAEQPAGPAQPELEPEAEELDIYE